MMQQRDTGDILSEQRDGVLIVTFNRPESMNSLTVEMDDLYREILAEAAGDPTVRAIVVTGSGRAFCAGAEVSALERLVEDPTRRHFGVEFHAPLLIDKPVVAAINGGCVGLGLVAALLCDVRIVANQAKIGTAFAQRGVVAEHGSAFLLSRTVGEGNARDLMLSARLIRGEESVRMGFASASVPREAVLDEAIAYAQNIAVTCAPWSLAMMKRQFTAGLLDAYKRDAALAADHLMEAFRGSAFAEGVHSYQQKRSPVFEGWASTLAEPTYALDASTH